MESERKHIYKILTRSEFEMFERDGFFEGSELDKKDGYIHSSTKEQVEKTRTKFFATHPDVHLLTIDIKGLDVRFETSPRSGETYPHIYESIPKANVMKVEKMD